MITLHARIRIVLVFISIRRESYRWFLCYCRIFIFQHLFLSILWGKRNVCIKQNVYFYMGVIGWNAFYQRLISHKNVYARFDFSFSTDKQKHTLRSTHMHYFPFGSVFIFIALVPFAFDGSMIFCAHWHFFYLSPQRKGENKTSIIIMYEYRRSGKEIFMRIEINLMIYRSESILRNFIEI